MGRSRFTVNYCRPSTTLRSLRSSEKIKYTDVNSSDILNAISYLAKRLIPNKIQTSLMVSLGISILVDRLPSIASFDVHQFSYFLDPMRFGTLQKNIPLSIIRVTLMWFYAYCVSTALTTSIIILKSLFFILNMLFLHWLIFMKMFLRYQDNSRISLNRQGLSSVCLRLSRGGLWPQIDQRQTETPYKCELVLINSGLQTYTLCALASSSLLNEQH